MFVELLLLADALEPEEWHNEQEKLRQLMPYKLPAKLVEYLKTGPLRLEFSEQKWVKWAELYSFMDVQEMTWKRKKLLSLMAAMDNYSDYLLLWSPRDKKLDDLLELVLDVGGELLFSRKKGEQGKPEGQPSVPDGGRRQQKTAFQPGKDPWEYQVKKPPWEK